MSENDVETAKDTSSESEVLVTELYRTYDLAVVASILALAILLGVLNNLRVADERKVKWFESPAVRTDLKTGGVAAQ